MKSADSYCPECMVVFDENEKVDQCFIGSKYKQGPCRSTYTICKLVDRFIKTQLLRNKNYFNVLYCAIAENIDIDSLYSKTDFSHDCNHKLYLIRAIVDIFIQIKGTYMAKQTNLCSQQDKLRSRLQKIAEFQGL